MCAFAIVSMVLSAMFVLTGMIPCLVPLNIVGVPAALATALLGASGLFVDRDPVTKARQHTGVYMLSVIVGLGLALLGFWRMSLGGGIL